MNILNRIIRYSRKKSVSFVKLERENFQPEQFEFNIRDLQKSFHLRKYILEFSHSTDQKYGEEVEMLKGELNYWSVVRMMKIYLIIAAVFFIWEFYFVNHQETSVDFAYKWNLQEKDNRFASLNNGGMEEGSQ